MYKKMMILALVIAVFTLPALALAAPPDPEPSGWRCQNPWVSGFCETGEMVSWSQILTIKQEIQEVYGIEVSQAEPSKVRVSGWVWSGFQNETGYWLATLSTEVPEPAWDLGHQNLPGFGAVRVFVSRTCGNPMWTSGQVEVMPEPKPAPEPESKEELTWFEKYRWSRDPGPTTWVEVRYNRIRFLNEYGVALPIREPNLTYIWGVVNVGFLDRDKDVPGRIALKLPTVLAWELPLRYIPDFGHCRSWILVENGFPVWRQPTPESIPTPDHWHWLEEAPK